MTIIRKIFNFFKRSSHAKFSVISFRPSFPHINPLIIFTIIVFFSSIFFILSNSINTKNEEKSENLKNISDSSEISKLTNFFISKINSPYKEVKYLIKNNDTVEKILKKFEVRNSDINKISTNLKRKKLSSIYSGRELNLILKEVENGEKTVINFLLPISNTTIIEIRKVQEDFIVKENILKLYKKEVVVKSSIENNLYNSAVKAGIEPNIIIEFARVFGFEVDFQRDIRKGNWFKIFYEKFEDDNNKVRDTGKIIYASMFVNGSEINLYNLNTMVKKNIMILREKYYKILNENSNKRCEIIIFIWNEKHPILGYNKMHRGTDFAAPSGTPIMASDQNSY